MTADGMAAPTLSRPRFGSAPAERSAEAPSPARPATEAAPPEPHVIVVGNEKGGAGKSTVSMHLAMALAASDVSVGLVDVDVRQRTLTRYIENRQNAAAGATAWASPDIITLHASDERDRQRAALSDAASVNDALRTLGRRCSVILIDAPGSDTALSRAAHARADTLVTPLNDSFIDFDLLGHVDPDTLETVHPSLYAEMVWACRKQRAKETRKPMDWVVLRNRMSPLAARNKAAVGEALEKLAKRIGFRLVPGLCERVIFRELFPKGLTLLDIAGTGEGEARLSMSHLAARQEVRDLLISLRLPPMAGRELGF